MTTEQHAYASAQAVATLTPTLDRRISPICGCGQDLDICAGEHCPRCGANIES